MSTESATTSIKFAEAVIMWYQTYGDRDLPWRSTGDWWKKLLAILLLRRTSTKLVARVYEEIIKRLPNPLTVAESSIEELEELLKNLGLYRQKARQMKQLVEALLTLHKGSIPCNYNELLQLPGIGEYAASEVMLTVCGKHYPPLDANVARVLERVTGIRRIRGEPYRDPKLVAIATNLAPKDFKRAMDFYYGLMDLARKVCLPRKPLCNKCPLNEMCHYHSIHALRITRKQTTG